MQKHVLNEQETTERVMRGVNEQLVAAQVRLSKTQQQKLNADIKVSPLSLLIRCV